jgi:hypothetical protein
MTDRDRAFDEWIDRARNVRIRDELGRRGLWTRRMEGDSGVPCPGCGGRDRFAVNARKNVFFCRKSGEGGDAIALVQHIDGVSFLSACEILNGEPPPGRASSETAEERKRRETEAIARARREDQRRLKQADDERVYRERERLRAKEIWDACVPLSGTQAEAYLAWRGLEAPAGARLRCGMEARLFNDARPPVLVYTGPALTAAIEGPDGRFAGVQQIFVDLAQPKGKLILVDANTGKVLPAKKTRGSVKGGFVKLNRVQSCASASSENSATFPADVVTRIIMGEGIETTLAVFCALAASASPLLAGTEFRAAVSLGNMAGKATGQIRHPTATKRDCRNRLRPVFVPDDVPKPDDDTPLMPIPESCRELVLLGDGDSDPFTTRLAMTRAVKRYQAGYPDLTIKLAWPRDGQDFNDQWREQREGVAA